MDEAPVSQRTRLLFALVGIATCFLAALCAELLLERMSAGATLRRDHSASLLFVTQPATTWTTIQPPPPPPDTTELQRRLDEVGASSGEVQITLAWNNINDLDLACVEPSGELIDGYNQASQSGGVLDVDMNATPQELLTPEANEIANRRSMNARQHRTAMSDRPVENLVWERNAPIGHYRVYVHQFCNKVRAAETPFWVVVRVRGQTHRIDGTVGREDFAENLVQPQLVYEFEVGPPKPVPPPAPPKPLAPKPLPAPIQVSHTAFSLDHMGFALMTGGLWGALAGLLPMALLVAQRRYLRYPAFHGRQDLIVAAGGPATGFAAALLGQLALSGMTAALAPSAYRTLLMEAWFVVGGLFGFALSYYTPNVSRIAAPIAGALSALAGSAIFLQLASHGLDFDGRVITACLIGGSIGALIALPEREPLPEPEPEPEPRPTYEIKPPFIVRGARTRKVGGIRQTGPRE